MRFVYGIIPALVILSVIIISNPFEASAVNEKVLVEYSQKIVWQFEDTGDLITKQNQFEEIMTEIIKESQKDFKKEFQTLDIKMDAKDNAVWIQGINEINGNTIYTVYPDISFTGTSIDPMSDAEFNILFDVMLSQMRIDMVQYFFDEGYTNVKTHIHYSDPTRATDYDEGF